jgi:predicted RNase H-like HicB family nuclease
MGETIEEALEDAKDAIVTYLLTAEKLEKAEKYT